jgi:hypothetical protein
MKVQKSANLFRAFFQSNINHVKKSSPLGLYFHDFGQKLFCLQSTLAIFWGAVSLKASNMKKLTFFVLKKIEVLL